MAQIVSAPPLPEVGHRGSQNTGKDGKTEPMHHIPGMRICPGTSWTFDQSGRQAPTGKTQNRNIEQKSEMEKKKGKKKQLICNLKKCS